MTNLERLVTEICLRAAAKVYAGTTGANLAGIAESAAEMLVELIICQEKGGVMPSCSLPTETYAEWITLNELLDEIGKEIPIADKVDVVGPVSRLERLAFEKAKVPVKRVEANLSGDGTQPEIKSKRKKKDDGHSTADSGGGK